MADAGGGGGAGAPFLAFVMIFIIGYLAWLTFIGPDDPNSKNPFICPPPPLGNGRTYNLNDVRKNTYEKICGSISTKGAVIAPPPTPKPGSNGKTKGVVRFERLTFAPKEKTPEREYISIASDWQNTEPINITGWKIGSAVSQQIYTIGSATFLPIPGKITSQQDIVLGPGERVYIMTGRSPIGTSFRGNICTGYLAQNQTFVPSMSKSCPLLREQLAITPETIRTIGDNCIDLIQKIGKCQYHSGSLPTPRYSAECQEFIHTRANYDGCVDTFRNTDGFYTKEWRVYLGRSEEIWRDRREIIRLYNQNGAVVDTLTY